MADYYVYAGFSEEHGGPDYIETRYDTSYFAALEFARETALETFDNFAAEKGLNSIDYYRALAKEDLEREDYTSESSYEEALEEYAQELYDDYKEDNIHYYVEEKEEEEDDEEYDLEYYEDEDEDEFDYEDDDEDDD